MKNQNPILLIDDDQIDTMMVRRALKTLGITNKLLVANSGEVALQLLQTTPQKPGLIISDINMPRMSGIEFLKIVKQDENFKKIPVIILTSSKNDKDRLLCFNNGVVGFFRKSLDFSECVNFFDVINKYWTLSESAE